MAGQALYCSDKDVRRQKEASLNWCLHIQRHVRLAKAGRARAFCLILLVASLSSTSVLGSSVAGQTSNSGLWVTNGWVSSIVLSAGRIYIGGGFSYVGPNTGGGAVVDSASGGLSATSPSKAGRVYAEASDGAGGW